jgi:flagellar basal-body rod protein FlgB
MLDSILGVHEAALTFKARRMEVLAGNLAKADTPHYKARDMEFADVLGRTRVAPIKTHARHLGVEMPAARDELKYRVPHQPAVDGNTVESDLELARYTENAVGYQASLMFINGRISTLRAALSGTRG